jgi:hypothetical protein
MTHLLKEGRKPSRPVGGICVPEDPIARGRRDSTVPMSSGSLKVS